MSAHMQCLFPFKGTAQWLLWRTIGKGVSRCLSLIRLHRPYLTCSMSMLEPEKAILPGGVSGSGVTQAWACYPAAAVC